MRYAPLRSRFGVDSPVWAVPGVGSLVWAAGGLQRKRGAGLGWEELPEGGEEGLDELYAGLGCYVVVAVCDWDHHSY